MSSKDPLLRPYRLKHLTLRNRIMSTAHEPAYSEDGPPKDRYRLYHVERAKGGIALTMTAGSAIVAEDSQGSGPGDSRSSWVFRSLCSQLPMNTPRSCRN